MKLYGPERAFNYPLDTHKINQLTSFLVAPLVESLSVVAPAAAAAAVASFSLLPASRDRQQRRGGEEEKMKR